MALKDYATNDGYDVQMQTNVISHFLLTKDLFPLLKKSEQKYLSFTTFIKGFTNEAEAIKYRN